MRLFRRRRKDRSRRSRRRTGVAVRASSPVPLSEAQVARVVALTRQRFAEGGIETVYGDSALHALDGRVYGLSTVVHLAECHPESEWPRLVDDHVRVLIDADRTPRPSTLAEVEDRLYLRLALRTDLPPAALEAARPVVGDIVALAAVDHPEHVSTLTSPDLIDQLGGWDAVCEVGLRNLQALRTDDLQLLGDDDGPTVHAAIGGFFQASRLLVLESLLRQDLGVERPSYGVLVAVPSRHLIAVHPVRGADLVVALQQLSTLAHSQSSGPAGLSPHVYLWRDGAMQQVTRDTEDGGVAVEVVGMLAQVMTELGLIEGE